MKKNLGVKVYLEYTNFWGEVTDSELIAQFRNMNWAKNFIEEAKKHEESLNDETRGESGWRIRVEEN